MSFTDLAPFWGLGDSNAPVLAQNLSMTLIVSWRNNSMFPRQARAEPNPPQPSHGPIREALNEKREKSSPQQLAPSQGLSPP